MSEHLPPLEVQPKSGDEPFHDSGDPLGFDLLRFWRWSGSDGPWHYVKSGHTCTLVDGTAYCWGAGESGQLGDGASGDGAQSSTPVLVPVPE